MMLSGKHNIFSDEPTEDCQMRIIIQMLALVLLLPLLAAGTPG